MLTLIHECRRISFDGVVEFGLKKQIPCGIDGVQLHQSFVVRYFDKHIHHSKLRERLGLDFPQKLPKKG